MKPTDECDLDRALRCGSCDLPTPRYAMLEASSGFRAYGGCFLVAGFSDPDDADQVFRIFDTYTELEQSRKAKAAR